MEYDVTEPVKAYKYYLKDAIHEAAINFFDGLANKNNIDIEGNRLTVKELEAARKKIENLNKTINGKKGLKTILIFCIVALFITAVIFLLLCFKNFVWWFILVIVGTIGAGVGLIFAIKSIKKKIQKVQKELNKYEEKRNSLLVEANTQMAPLNNDFDENIPAKLLSETIPLIKMDQCFDQNKFYYLKKKYGFLENEENISSQFIQSGSILGNPFILERNMVREMRNHTYEGHLLITWTTVEGSGKDRRVVAHSQTLVAQINKPRPEYFNETWLVYGNEAAPKLSFSRSPVKAPINDEKKLKKYVDKMYENLQEKAQKTKGKSITLMTNDDFEVLFNATNRDNDVEFRLLFTPLAQKNILDLIKNGAYGDDIKFIKNKGLNYIKSQHMQSAEIDGNPRHFINYNYDKARNDFINYVDNYFKAYYFDLAPLLSIPLYQQHMSFEEIFKGTVDPNFSSLETEVIANKYESDVFKHHESDTPAILKREFIRKNGEESDMVNIHAHSYKAIKHIEYVSKLGRDGCHHQVPVEWYEYVPLEQVTPLAVQSCQISEKKFKCNVTNPALNDFLSRLADRGIIIYERGLISFLPKDNVTSYNASELNNYLQKDN